MSFLQESPLPGYPNEYLLTRLRGMPLAAKVQEMTEATPPEVSSVKSWRDSQRFLNWLFNQASFDLRRMLTPVFTLLEFHTLVLCLRWKASPSLETVENLLSGSLLAPSLQRILLREKSRHDSIALLSGWLTHHSRQLGDLSRAYAEAGLRGVEETLYSSYLRATLHLSHPWAIRRVLSFFVDRHNLLGLYKKLRWQLAAPRDYLNDGLCSVAGLKRVEREGTLQDLVSLLPRYSDQTELNAERIEAALPHALQQDLQRAGRTGDDLAAILAFLWRYFILIRNGRLQQFDFGGNRPILEAEMIP